MEDASADTLPNQVRTRSDGYDGGTPALRVCTRDCVCVCRGGGAGGAAREAAGGGRR